MALGEMVELPDHPHFIGCQFHPEFKSKPLEPRPLFKTFVGAAYEHGLKRLSEKAASEVEMFHRPEKVGKKIIYRRGRPRSPRRSLKKGFSAISASSAVKEN